MADLQRGKDIGSRPTVAAGRRAVLQTRQLAGCALPLEVMQEALMGVRYGSVVERRARLRRELDEILSRLVDVATEKVILLGSAASGEVASTSDLDLLVIRRDDRRPADRVDELYRRIRPRVVLDLLVYTPEELEEARRISSFVRSALREGVVLYDRSGTLARASQA